MGDILSGGTSRQAIAQDLELYKRMRQQQAQQPAPVLHSHGNPHEYLFIALFDGSGQDVNNPKQLPTSIGELWIQARRLEHTEDSRIGTHYVPGVGTQDHLIPRLVDGATAYTWHNKIEKMYTELAGQTQKWRHQDPQAQVRLLEVGYSRGAVLVPGLARLVDQYGIVDPKYIEFGRDTNGNLTVESNRTLIPPGQVAQAVGLFDPVATNMPANYDARLPPSVVSGFSLIARDEQRELFPHQTIIAPQRSADGRFLSVPVPGGHSNVGGGNSAAGLETMAFNGMADYLNALSDRPLFEHRPVPTDPAQYTIYQAQGATAVWGARIDHDGQRNLRTELANCKIVDPCRDAEPVNRELAQQLPWRLVQPAAVERVPALPQSISVHREAQQVAPESAVESRAPSPSAQTTSQELDRDSTRALQHNLGQLGFTDSRGRALADDGHYSPDTQAAVAAFQREQGLPATGMADSITLGAVHAHVVVADLQQHRAAPEMQSPSLAHDMGAVDARPAQIQTIPPKVEREPLSYLDRAHPHHLLFQELREKLPAGTSNEKVAELTLAARERGVRSNRNESVHALDNGDAWVLGMTPGFNVKANLHTPAPPLAETMQKAEVFEQMDAQRVAQWREQSQSQSQSHGRAM